MIRNYKDPKQSSKISEEQPQQTVFKPTRALQRSPTDPTQTKSQTEPVSPKSDKNDNLTDDLNKTLNISEITEENTQRTEKNGNITITSILITKRRGRKSKNPSPLTAVHASKIYYALLEQNKEHNDKLNSLFNDQL